MKKTYLISWKTIDVRYREIEAKSVTEALGIAKSDPDNYDTEDSYNDEFVCVEENEIDED